MTNQEKDFWRPNVLACFTKKETTEAIKAMQNAGMSIMDSVFESRVLAWVDHEDHNNTAKALADELELKNKKIAQLEAKIQSLMNEKV